MQIIRETSEDRGRAVEVHDEVAARKKTMLHVNYAYIINKKFI